MKDNELFNEISKEVSSMPIFDTHEHLQSEEERRTKPLDVFYLFSHYVGSDLIASGMPEAEFNSLFEQSIEIEKRWNLFSPYLENRKVLIMINPDSNTCNQQIRSLQSYRDQNIHDPCGTGFPKHRF